MDVLVLIDKLDDQIHNAKPVPLTDQVRWYADLSGRNRKHPDGPLRTYRHRWVPKRGGKSRLL